MTGGKKSKQGTPQGGVVSPLLANIYINRLLRHWRKTGAAERLGQIISYADDFVIVCASRRQAEESLALVLPLAGEAWPDDPSHQDAPLSRPRRAVRLLGLHLRSGSALADWEAIHLGP